MKKGLALSESNYGSVKENKYDLVILPWGATEPHNLHLPYTTDGILSEDIAVDTAIKVWNDYQIRCMVLPPVLYGSQNPGQHDLPFCIHARYETQKSILKDTVASLYHQGFRKLLIINGHGGNIFKNMIRDLYLDYPDFLIASTEWYTICSSKEYFEATIDDHAAETETSVMMYYHPERALLSEAGIGESYPFKMETLNHKIAWVPRHWDKSSRDSGIGNPMNATAEKGKRFADAVVDGLSQLYVDMAKETLY